MEIQKLSACVDNSQMGMAMWQYGGQICNQWQRRIFLIGMLVLCFLTTTEAGTSELMDQQQCPQLMIALFRDCSNYLGKPITNSTLNNECCHLAKQANDAYCYCDSAVLEAGKGVGLTGTAIEAALVLYCSMPTNNLNILNMSGCAPVLAPDLAPAPTQQLCDKLTDVNVKDCNSAFNHGPAPAPTVISVTDEQLCLQLTVALFRDCTKNSGSHAMNLTITPDCCRLAKEANDAFCYCNNVTIASGAEMGYSFTSFTDSLVLFCNVPREDLNLFNISGCGIAPPPAPPLAPVPVLDQQQCQQLTFLLFKDCYSSLGSSSTNLTRIDDCCKLTKQADDAYCFCDATLLDAGMAVGVTPASIQASVVLFCGIPSEDLNIRNISGCDGSRPVSPSAPLPALMGPPIPGTTLTAGGNAAAPLSNSNAGAPNQALVFAAMRNMVIVMALISLAMSLVA